MLHVVNTAIESVGESSEKSRLIKESMDQVSDMAERVRDVILKTNEILN